MFIEFTSGQPRFVARTERLSTAVKKKLPRALGRIVDMYHEYMERQFGSSGADPGPRWASNAWRYANWKAGVKRRGGVIAYDREGFSSASRQRRARANARYYSRPLVLTGAAYDALVDGTGEFSAEVGRRGSRHELRMGPTGEVARYMGFHLVGGRHFPVRDWSVRGGQFRGNIQLRMAQSIRGILRER